ncbi:MAG: hypothetical protein ACOY3Y_21190 [Acidobacteriota bacterium]
MTWAYLQMRADPNHQTCTQAVVSSEAAEEGVPKCAKEPKPVLIRALEHAGKAGWELVAVAGPLPEDGGYVFWLKRQL